MSKKMLIDASHSEETRVVVLDGTKVEEFDFETVTKRQLAGNIYLAKVMRVEPSLQAAFVDYGGNRHGFLAFSEIHPDYYQIPVADREALLAEEREQDTVAADADAPEPAAETDDAAGRDAGIESLSDADVADEMRPRRAPPRRYKIQEVIKARQILLVQVVKEERGTKGAALTTYLSLPGRYCVLMPNTARGGGISRKITNAADRKRLKSVTQEMKVPEGAGLIVRTAGAQRTKAEIRRDYDYLLRLWDQIRELTLKSIAPAPIYEEGNLVKRAIRDYYTREIEEVLVEGAEGYRTAKDFMKMIMPSHARHVKQYSEPVPLFARHQVESYLASMFNPRVDLKSGGYIIIGVTEALVAIDVNSGKATREGSIEQTAHTTNLEAAEEIARQLRLRDLAGLIVIDFIDMEEKKHNAAVEKRLKDRLKSDRARIQLGRISGFGLLEMSRQRLRPGMVEATTQPCPHCHGTGLIRSDESLALAILRQIEEEGGRGRAGDLALSAPVSVANFLFNTKRAHLASIESRYGLTVGLVADDSLTSPDFRLDKSRTTTRADGGVAARPVVSVDGADAVTADDDEEDVEGAAEAGTDAEGDQKSRKRRRRRRRKSSGSDETAQTRDEAETEASSGSSETTQDDAEPAVEAAAETEGGEAAATKRKTTRSRRRSGRNRKTGADTAGADPGAAAAPTGDGPPEAAEAPAPAGAASAAAEPDAAAQADDAEGAAPDAPRTAPSGRRDDDVADTAEATGQAPDPDRTENPEPAEAGSGASRTRRRGWWAIRR